MQVVGPTHAANSAFKERITPCRRTPAHLLDLLTGYVLHVIGHLDDARRVALQRHEPVWSACGFEPWVCLAVRLFDRPAHALHVKICAAWAQAQDVVFPLPPACFARVFVEQHLMRAFGDDGRETSH